MVIQTIQTVISCLFPIIGVICVLLPRYVTTILPYLLGGTMILAGIFKVWNDIQNRKILNQYPYELAHGMILFIMGAAFVLQGSKALGPIGTTWAIIGIRKASISLGTAIQKIDQKERFAAPILEFLLRITLALILLFDPFEKFSTHIMILGFELIAISVQISKNFLPALEDEGNSL